jgi:phosphatidylserine/phosphatidylglycerophosphate/cardiolipin synthase-like enzyme
MITMGRYGSLLYSARPSDDAIEAMFKEARTIIRCALQDLGPITIPGTKIAVPGCVWPKTYLKALGEAIYKRGVDVEIVLSNPGSIPGNLSPTEALYGNGWTCADVASEIIKSIKELDEDVEDDQLRKMVQENLRLCYLKQGKKHKWGTEKTKGMHAKHFIIDDSAYYIGSQNLYVCDLAEWGILVDDPKQTAKAMQEYWIPMWDNSYHDGVDCDVDEVMDGLDVSRDGESLTFASHSTRLNATKALAGNSGSSDYYSA